MTTTTTGSDTGIFRPILCITHTPTRDEIEMIQGRLRGMGINVQDRVFHQVDGGRDNGLDTTRYRAQLGAAMTASKSGDGFYLDWEYPGHEGRGDLDSVKLAVEAQAVAHLRRLGNRVGIWNTLHLSPYHRATQRQIDNVKLRLRETRITTVLVNTYVRKTMMSSNFEARLYMEMLAEATRIGDQLGLQASTHTTFQLRIRNGSLNTVMDAETADYMAYAMTLTGNTEPIWWFEGDNIEQRLREAEQLAPALIAGAKRATPA